MATFFRPKATVVALAVLTLTLAGGGIAVAAQPSAKAPTSSVQPGARQPGSGSQPPVTAAAARRAQAAMRASLAPPPAGTAAWAVVSANGVLLQHSANVVSAQRFTCCGAGQYEVILDYDVHSKAFTATIGTNDAANVPPSGEVAVAPRYLISNAVFVQTRSSSGNAADRSFHLAIHN